MEFTEFWKQQKRMCKFYNGKCRENHCELHILGYDACILSIKNNPEKAEAIVAKWVSEHPVQTNADKLEEVFGLELKIDQYSKICRILKCDGMNCNECKYIDCDWWDKEYIPPESEEE